jgi:peptidoglycan DL-endopeptidase CwlO
VSRATRRIAALALVVALVLLVSGGPAHGDPTDDKRAQARVLQAEIDANGARIGALSEQYNGAQYRLEQAQAAIADAEQKLVATEAEVERLRALVNERGAALYRGVGQGGPIALDVSSANSLIASSKYSTVAAEHDTKLLDDLRRAERALRDQRAQAEQARAEAEDEQREIVKTRASVDAANAQQEQLLSQVNGEIAQLVAEEQARKEAAGLAAAQARYAAAAARPRPRSARASLSAVARTPPSHTRAPSSASVMPCRRRPQLLRLLRADHAGVGRGGREHAALLGRAVLDVPEVPLGAMQPGDLVFWGPGGSQHVGPYIGAAR